MSSTEIGFFDIERMLKTGELSARWDSYFFSGGRDWGDQDTYTLTRNGQEVGTVQDNWPNGMTIELDGVRICQEMNEDDLVEYMELALEIALLRDDKELITALGVNEQTPFWLPRDDFDISREDVLEGRWTREEYERKYNDFLESVRNAEERSGE